MQIPSGTNYIDACALLMLLNKKDDLRTALGLKDKPAKSIIRKNLLPIRIPMPALGEAFKKARIRASTGMKSPASWIPCSPEKTSRGMHIGTVRMKSVHSAVSGFSAYSYSTNIYFQ